MASETHAHPIYFLVPGPRNTFTVHILPVKPKEPNSTLLKNVHQLCTPGHPLRRFLRNLTRTLLMRRLAIAKIDLSQALPTADIESGCSVLFYRAQLTKDEFLTFFLHEKSRIALKSSSISEYILNQEWCSKRNSIGCRSAWYLYYELSGRMAAMWLLVALFISATGGIAATFAGDANLGFNVGTCVLAVLSAVQWLLIMSQK